MRHLRRKRQRSRPRATTETVSAESPATPDTRVTEETSESAAPESPRSPAVVVTKATANTADAVVAVPEEVDTSGLTADGRAVNDPRITPRPVTETAVATELTLLFAAPEAPPVSVVAQNSPRASNDPRGPKSAAAGK